MTLRQRSSSTPTCTSIRPAGLPRRGLGVALSALLGLAAATTPAGVARAQTNRTRVATSNGEGMDLHLFRPTIDSKGFFSVNGAEILGGGDISFGLVIDYGHELMQLNAGHDTGYMMDHAFQGTFHFDYGIGNVVVVGLSAPIDLNAGNTASDIGPTGATYSDDKLDAQTLGDVALHAKVRLARPDGPLGVAIVLQGGTALGGERDFTADPGFFYWPQLALERRLLDNGALRLGLNGGYRGHTGKNPQFGLGLDGTPQLKSGVFEYSNLLTGGFGASYRALAAVDLVAETYLTQQLGGSSDSNEKLSAEAIGGVKLFVERNSYLMLAGGVGYTKGFEAANQRFILGFIFEPSVGDRDGDGFKDDVDDCPDEAEDFDGFQDTRADSPAGKVGCPDPDNDNDGILDVDDRCANVPEDRDGDQDDDGCPEGNDGDRDGDGILDSHDKCPDSPEDRDGFEDKDGCPDPDNDKDGLPDAKDLCPNDPEDVDGFEDENGCPDPDNDKDGIFDAIDRCPNEPETFNGSDDEDGCPDEGKVIVQDNNVLILDKINFKTGSAEILPESQKIVEAVATTLVHHPELVLLEVQGHADERGVDDMNLKLTEARARSVMEALVAKGVDKSRLRSMGYGEYCPLDPASSAAAWEKNRRVEFKIVRTSTGPTGVELGCDKAKAKGVVPAAP